MQMSKTQLREQGREYARFNFPGRFCWCRGLHRSIETRPVPRPVHFNCIKKIAASNIAYHDAALARC